jgi:uncharacterized membrane protein
MVTENTNARPVQPGAGQKLYQIVKAIFRILLGASLLFAGISHLTVARTEFLAQVPTWLPVNADLVVVLSGVAEITLGLALIFLARQRTWVGLATAAFFVLIFPGNISQYVNQIDAFGLDTDQARFMRLFFQPVLVLWALWSTDAWRVFLPKKAKS